MDNKRYTGDGIVLRRKTWWLDAVIDGRRHQRKLGKGISRSAAVNISHKYRAEIHSGNVGYGKRPKDPTFDEVREKFLDSVKADKKPNTVRSYSACLNELGKEFNGKRLSQITPWALEAYKKKRCEPRQLGACPPDVSEREWKRRCRVAEKGAPVRCNRELAVLKMLFNRARDWGAYEGANPVLKVKFRKEPKTRLRFLEPDEEGRLLAVARGPLRTLILVGLHTGLRIHAEALTLTWASVDLKRGLLTVEAAYSKNGKCRSVGMNPVVRAALDRLPRTGEVVFAGCGDVGKAFRKACAAAKITGVTPHTLRHTFASRLAMAGVDLRTIQELGGWQSVTMVQRYSHLSRAHKVNALDRLAELFPVPEARDIHSALPEADAASC